MRAHKEPTQNGSPVTSHKTRDQCRRRQTLPQNQPSRIYVRQTYGPHFKTFLNADRKFADHKYAKADSGAMFGDEGTGLSFYAM